MSADALTIRLPHPRRLVRARALVALASATCGACVALVALALTGSARQPAPATVYAPPDAGFHVTLPAGWTALSSPALAQVPGRPLAVLRRTDRRGLVIVRRAAPVAGRLPALEQGLSDRLRHALRGFTPVSSRVATIRSGPAFVYTFAFGATVETVATAAMRSGWYEIDGVVPADAPDAARQVGAMVASFGR